MNNEEKELIKDLEERIIQLEDKLKQNENSDKLTIKKYLKAYDEQIIKIIKNMIIKNIY